MSGRRFLLRASSLVLLLYLAIADPISSNFTSYPLDISDDDDNGNYTVNGTPGDAEELGGINDRPNFIVCDEAYGKDLLQSDCEALSSISTMFPGQETTTYFSPEYSTSPWLHTPKTFFDLTSE